MSDLKNFAATRETARITDKLSVVEHDLSIARHTIGEQEHELEALRKVASYHARPLKPPRFLGTPRSGKQEHLALLGTMLSDLHLDEVVNSAEMNYLNSYDRKIAEGRLERYFSNMVKITHGFWAGMKYTGIVLMLNGDLLTGVIHDELRETNEALPLDSMFYWARKIAAGIEFWLETFNLPIYVPVVVGNHGRLTVKPRAKRAARDNFDWGIGQLLASHFANDERVTFDITDSIDIRFDMYDVRFLMSHGDKPRTTGGNGIAGIWPYLFRTRGKKLVQWQHDPFDQWVIGHFHQYIPINSGFGMNGSGKGWDEFSLSMGFRPEPAQQMLFTVTPEKGITFQAPIIVSDRKKEGW